MQGMGCVKPRLLTLGANESTPGPVLLSGGRLCVENKTDVRLWFSPDGMAGMDGHAPWQTHSLAEVHNKLWQGDPGYKFDLSEINNPKLFATQSYTTLIQTAPDEAIVAYNHYYHPNDGSPGCLSDYPCDRFSVIHGLNHPPAVAGSTTPAGTPCLPSSCAGNATCQEICAAAQRCFNCTGKWPAQGSGSCRAKACASTFVMRMRVTQKSDDEATIERGGPAPAPVAAITYHGATPRRGSGVLQSPLAPGSTESALNYNTYHDYPYNMHYSCSLDTDGRLRAHEACTYTTDCQSLPDGGVDCSNVTLLNSCWPPMTSFPTTAGCTDGPEAVPDAPEECSSALDRMCGGKQGPLRSVFDCASCAGDNQRAL